MATEGCNLLILQCTHCCSYLRVEAAGCCAHTPTRKEGNVCDGVPGLLLGHRAVPLLGGRLEHLWCAGPAAFSQRTTVFPPGPLHYRYGKKQFSFKLREKAMHGFV